MSRPRFLADHDLNDHIVIGVRRHDPLSEFDRVRDLGMSDRPDEEILEYADRQGLIIVSHDVNTMPAEAYAWLAIAGLLMVQQTSPVRIIIEDLFLIWSTSESEEWRDQVCFLPLV